MKGFTLVEILVSVVILGFLFAVMYGVLNIGNIVFKDDIMLVELQQQVRQGMNRMVNEIRESKSSEVTIISGNTISFKVPPAVYGDLWVGPISYYRDVNDTNSDGVTDQIIREYPQNTRKILANNITSLSFCLTGDVLEIQVAAKKTIGARQLCFPAPCLNPQRTLKEIVRLRNKEG